MSGSHCPTCACSDRDGADRDGGFTIYAPNEGFYGRCGTCNEVRWQVDRDDDGEGSRRTTHCGCCTHRHNLPNGGHGSGCLAEPPQCNLLRENGRPVFSSLTVNYPGRR